MLHLDACCPKTLGKDPIIPEHIGRDSEDGWRFHCAYIGNTQKGKVWCDLLGRQPHLCKVTMTNLLNGGKFGETTSATFPKRGHRIQSCLPISEAPQSKVTEPSRSEEEIGNRPRMKNGRSRKGYKKHTK